MDKLFLSEIFYKKTYVRNICKMIQILLQNKFTMVFNGFLYFYIFYIFPCSLFLAFEYYRWSAAGRSLAARCSGLGLCLGDLPLRGLLEPADGPAPIRRNSTGASKRHRKAPGLARCFQVPYTRHWKAPGLARRFPVPYEKSREAFFPRLWKFIKLKKVRKII